MSTLHSHLRVCIRDMDASAPELASLPISELTVHAAGEAESCRLVDVERDHTRVALDARNTPRASRGVAQADVPVGASREQQAAHPAHSGHIRALHAG